MRAPPNELIVAGVGLGLFVALRGLHGRPAKAVPEELRAYPRVASSPLYPHMRALLRFSAAHPEGVREVMALAEELARAVVGYGEASDRGRLGFEANRLAQQVPSAVDKLMRVVSGHEDDQLARDAILYHENDLGALTSACDAMVMNMLLQG